MINWGRKVIDMDIPEGFPTSYLDGIKEEMKEHITNGGKPSDERSEKIFLKLCRFVDTFQKQPIDWDKTAKDYI